MLATRRAVGAAVQQRLQMDAGDRAIALDAGFEVHQHRMTSAMAVEHFLARQTDLDRSIEQPGCLRDDNFVVEGIAFAAEAPAIRCGNDPDVGGRHLERLGQRAVHVMRRLRGRPEHQLAVRIFGRDGRMLFNGQVRVALIKECVFEYLISVGKGLVDVAESERDNLVDVAAVAVLVDGVGCDQSFFRARNRLQWCVLDVDQIERFERRQFVACDDRRHRVADEPDALDRQGILVLTDRKNAVRDRKIASGQDQVDAGMRQGASHVDADDACVRDGGTEQLAVDHPRQRQVVGEAGLAGDFGACVDARPRFADDVHERTGR